MTHACTILVVDDDPDILESTSLVLGAEGWRTLAAPDGEAALNLLRHGPRPCLILLDMMMPRMNGWDFRAAQAADLSIGDIPVVIVTGDSRPREKAEQLGAHGWLAKPVELDELTATVRSHCHAPGP